MVLTSIMQTASLLPASLSAWDIFFSEFLGTALMMATGTAVNAANTLPKSKGRGSGWVLITIGWGFAVFIGVYGGWKTGGHLNPAVTLAKVVAHGFDPSVTLNGAAIGEGGVAVNGANVALYLAGQFLGAFVGAVVAWLAFKKHYDEPLDNDSKLGTFSTMPAIRSYGWNFCTELVATAILVTFVLVSGGTPTQIGPVAIAFVIVVLGMGLGGPTGYAMNPARDLSPRIAFTILPIPGKTSSDWAYSWVPILGPLAGAVVGTVISYGLNMAA